jgi:hypothetical protein
MAGEDLTPVTTRLIVAGLVVLACACSGADEAKPTPSPPPGPTAAPESAKAWTVRPTKDYLSCAPDTVGPDDVLILRMKQPHGASLHVGAPDGTPYIVIFHGSGQPDRGARRTLMNPAAFTQLSELRLGVRTLTGGVWVFGRDTNEVVFRAPGIYRVRVGNDMETDGPDYAECLVTYRP